jgi:hypothetical protein
MSLRRPRSRLFVQLVQFGAVAALGGMAIGAKHQGPAPVVAQAPAPVSKTGFVALERGTHPLARPEFDIGRLDPQKHISNLSLGFKLTPEKAAERDALVQAVSDPASPKYRQFLSPEDYAARFGAKPDDIARTEAWLRSQGLEVYPTRSRLGARVTFGGTVAQLEAAFRTEMHQYRVGKETHYAMASAPSVPASLADIVLGITNTHDFYVRPENTAAHGDAIKHALTPDSQCPSTSPLGLLCQSDAGAGKPPTLAEGIAPPDWRAIYDVNPLYTTGVGGSPVTGTGVTVGIVGTSEVLQADLTQFWTMYGITTGPTINTIVVPNTGSGGNQGGSAIEAVLDNEEVGAMAPGATINYYVVGTDDQNVDDATFYAIEDNKAAILSESWGGCEAQIPASDADLVQVYGSAAALLGMTYLASSGDQMATSCINFGLSGLYVNIPAAYPTVTSVGGTGFAISPSALSFTGTSGTLTHVASGYPAAAGAEGVWNESDDPNSQFGVGGGGGGVSVLFPRPYYQTQTTAPTCTMVGTLPVTGVTASAMRQVPDISFTAAGGSKQYGLFIYCTLDISLNGGNGDCTFSPTVTKNDFQVVIPIGGTSASAPAFAGVMALASQAAGGRLGNINPLLYALPSTVFHDVTKGDNEVLCTSGTDPGCPAGGKYGYPAETGFDCASGLGSLDANKFVTAVSALKATTITLAPVTSPLTSGTAVPLTATITAPTAGAKAMTGSVLFTFQSYLSNGTPDPDMSWTLGTTAISGGTTTGATVSSSPTFAIPEGLVNSGQGVDVVAAYGGDGTFLPATSAKVHVTFAPLSMCFATPEPSVALGGTQTMSITGGTAPYKFEVISDGTRAPLSDGGQDGTSIDETTGALTAASVTPGYVVIAAFDSNNAETLAGVTVGTPPASATAPWTEDAGFAIACAPAATGSDAGTGSDGGTGTGSDSGTGTGNDSGTGTGTNEDSGTGSGGGTNPSSSSGCHCTTAGQGAPGSNLAGLGGVLLGLTLAARRRRSRSS